MCCLQWGGDRYWRQHRRARIAGRSPARRANCQARDRWAWATCFAGIGAADYDAQRHWYERFFGRAADLVPNEIEVCWQVTDSAWMYVKADAERAGSAFHTLLVDDLDAWLAGLAERGIASGPVDTHSDGVRVALVTDPEGNTIQLGQVPAG
jgi:predicted enzyme related to lactoylglutathione lyase